jgi:1-hydroxycarotenoid 3,4-desaturase
VVIIGAGIGGLVAAIALAAKGVPVTLLEKEAKPGGKMRELVVGDALVDAGPTVFTMKWVFDELFDGFGSRLEDEVTLERAEVLARHAWSADERLDLFADVERSIEAIARFSSPAEGERFRRFCARTAEVYRTLEGPFLRSSRPTILSLHQRVGWWRWPEMLRLRPLSTLWGALGSHFTDPRLRQLYGRYATYCGSSPFKAAATLMIVAHVEQDGVWLVVGGMARLAEALARVAERLGVTLRCGATVETILTEGGRVAGVRLAGGESVLARAVIANSDANAVASGLLGDEVARAVQPVPPAARSLSAMAWTFKAQARGFPLARHSVFFSRDYAREFDQIFRQGMLPDDPTVYLCAQDRDGTASARAEGWERLLCLVNAPASGDRHVFDAAEISRCQERTLAQLERCGLTLSIDPAASVMTTPTDFHRLFPATGGALYGRASHGWMASFQRPDTRTSLPGLYLAGGSIHPGPGVPMAALSGRMAANSVLSDFGSTNRSRPVAMSGGMSTA